MTLLAKDALLRVARPRSPILTDPVGPVMKMLSHLRSRWMMGGDLVCRKWSPFRICLHQLRSTLIFISLNRFRYLHPKQAKRIWWQIFKTHDKNKWKPHVGDLRLERARCHEFSHQDNTLPPFQGWLPGVIEADYVWMLKAFQHSGFLFKTLPLGLGQLAILKNLKFLTLQYRQTPHKSVSILPRMLMSPLHCNKNPTTIFFILRLKFCMLIVCQSNW